MGFSKSFFIVFFTFVFSANFSSANSKKPPIEVSISPTGEIESAEQVRIDFSEAVVRLGENQDDLVPADSNCFTDENEEARGRGYWTDEKTWVFNFTKPAPPDTVCKITMLSDFKAHNNRQINLSATAEFKTLVSQIIKSFPDSYESISSDQYFLLRLSGKPKSDWIKNNVYFTIKNIGDRIKAEILPLQERDRLFQQLSESDNGLKWYIDSTFGPADETGKYKVDMDNWVAVKADRPFPRNSSIILNWLEEYPFDVRRDFNANFTCDRETFASGCVPISNMTLNFSDEISAQNLKKIYLQKSDGTKIFAKELKTTNSKSGVNYLTFEGPFLANTKYSLIVDKVKSLDGETLVNQNAFPLTIETAQLPSLLKVDRLFSVIEASNPVLPVHVRNVEFPLATKNYQTKLPGKAASVVLTSEHVEKIIDTLKMIHSAESEKPLLNPSDFKIINFKTPKKFANEKTEVIGLPLKNKGLHFIEFQSRLLGQKLNYEPNKDPDYYVRSLSLVTNLNITLKYSNDEVLAWVTSLDKAEPVFNAEVALVSNSGNVIKTQKTNQAGMAFFKLSAKESADLNARILGAYGPFSYGFFAFAKLQDDFSFVWSSDDQGLESYRFGLNLPYNDPEIIYHAILERNLLRPKEKLRAKLIYRKLENSGLSIPPIQLPPKIEIRDSIAGKRHLVPAKWDAKTGTGTIDWIVPEEAQLGSYKISFPTRENDPEDDEEFSAPERSGYDNEENIKTFGTFNVEEFQVPNISTNIRALDTPWVNKSNPQVEFTAGYLSGGPAAGLPIKVRYNVENSSLYLPDDDLKEFEWQGGGVKEGVTKTGQRSSRNEPGKSPQLLETKLDKFGRVIIDLKNIEKSIQQQSVVMNFEYKDANGEIKTTTRSYDLIGTNTLVGIKSTSWYQTHDNFEYQAMLVDSKLKPLADKKVTLIMYKIENFSSRKKILGGFYSYESFEEVKKAKELCIGKTDSTGRLNCKGSDKSLSGEYVVVAETTDESGKKVNSKISSYLSGGEYWFGGSDSDRMDLIPTKRQYEPGETAEFQVRGPISEGQLLVTVERAGILYKVVQSFSQKDPTIKLRVSEDWAPNVVVSATLIRGRIDGAVSGTLDLGKPALKMGLTSIKVGLRKHQLKINVKADKNTYEPRDQVMVQVDAKDLNEQPVNAEVAVAVIDEGLLQLSQNNTWNLLDVFLSPRAHKVKAAYLISHVIGKRTLGLKAVPSGGDGGGMRTRELFETSLYWNPRVKLVNGKAQIKFKTLDSLTGYRVVVIAQNQTDQFGLGITNFTVNKEIQSFPALALAVREGDRYDARFTVRNSGSRNVNLKAELNISDKVLTPIEFTLKANEARELMWPTEAGHNLSEQKFNLKITEGTKTVDSLKISQPILPVWTLRSFGNSLKQDAKINFEIGIPAGSTKAELHLTALPSLSSDLPAIKNYWNNYVYDCFEQRYSRALQTDSRQLFDDLMKISGSYIHSNGLLKYYPSSRYGSIFLTNFILQTSHYKGWELDEELKNEAIRALKSYFNGTLASEEPHNKKYAIYTKIETFDTLMLYNEIDAAQFESLNFNIETLPNNYLSHLISILSRDPKIKNAEQMLAKALQTVRGRMQLSSTRLTIRESLQSDVWGFYLNEDMSESKLLNQLFRQKSFHNDGGRLILGFLERAKNGYWYNTMSNTWALLTLKIYKETFEKTPVSGELSWGIEGNLAKTKIQNIEKRLKIPLSQNTKALSEFTGEGTPWVNFLILANPPQTSHRMRGIEIEKKWTPVEVKNANEKNVGDIWEITLKISSKSEFQWLAVRDPYPPGAIVIEEDGAYLSAKKAVEYQIFEDWFYGEQKVYKYKIRLNQSGTFILPTTISEAMYDRDLNSELLNEIVTIKP